jgi:hypothetical protein
MIINIKELRIQTLFFNFDDLSILKPDHTNSITTMCYGQFGPSIEPD